MSLREGGTVLQYSMSARKDAGSLDFLRVLGSRGHRNGGYFSVLMNCQVLEL